MVGSGGEIAKRSPKVEQTINFPAITTTTYGTTFDLAATASSNLAVDFKVISGSATLSGKTLTITGMGNITIEATQNGNDGYLAANPVRQTFTVTKATQTINFTAIQNKILGEAAFDLQATASSGLAVTFSVVSGPATLSGNTLTLNDIGEVTLKATQVGNANYLSADTTQRFLVMSPDPKLVLTQENGREINTGDTVVLDSTSLEVAVSQRFKIQNLGAKELTLTNLDVPTGYQVVNNFPTTIASGDITSFELQLMADNSGSFEGVLSFATNDPDRNTFQLNLKGTVINNPKIELVGNNQSILNGSTTANAENHTHFGAVELSDTPITRTFTIKNTGEGILKLSGSPVVQITGADAEDFSVTVQPETKLTKGNQTNFEVTFTPTSVGVKQAQLVITNNDADEGDFTFTITGEVLTPTALTGQLLVDKIKVFPNPVSERLQLTFSQAITSAVQIQLIDNQGRVVKRQTEGRTQEGSVSIRTNDLKPGVYTLVIQAGAQRFTHKILKK